MRSVKNEDPAHSRGWAAHVYSDHTEDSSCDFLAIMTLSYFNSFSSSVCVAQYGKAIFHMCLLPRDVILLTSKKYPTLGFMQQLFCLTGLFWADVLWFTSWQVWASVFASVIAPLTPTCHQFTFHRFRCTSLKIGGSSRGSQWLWLSGRPLRISHCWFICWTPPYMSWDHKKETDVASCGWQERISTFSL